MHRRALRVVLAGILSTFLAEASGAQVECIECSLAVDTIAVFGSLSDAFSPAPQADVAGDGKTFLVGPLEGMPDAVAVYSLDSDPWILGDTGDGPGEFRGVTAVEFQDGQFFVFSGGRETRFSDDLSLLGTHSRRTGSMGAVAISPEESVVQHIGIQEDEPRVLLSLRRGSDLGFFGSGVKIPLNAKNHVGFLRILGQGIGGTFWTAPNNRYDFARWSPSRAAPEEVIRVEKPWFPETAPDPETVINPLEERPPPVLVAIREQEDGHLWVASLHPREDWKAMTAGSYEERLSMYPETVFSVVDILDAGAGESRARLRLEGMVVSFPAPGLVAVRDVGEYGLTTIRIVSINLEEGTE